jgi:mono/diheme cytochrome c family protein
MSTPRARWPLRRIVLVPIVLFALVSGVTFALAQLHLAKPAESAAGPPTLGDPQQGQLVFKQTCAGCHGANAEGKIGPGLAGAHLTVAQAKTQIDNGGGIMPGGLVKGDREADVLAYLETIFAR